MKHRLCRGRASLAGLCFALGLWGLPGPVRAWSAQPVFDTKNVAWLFGGAPLFHADGTGVLLEGGLVMPLGKLLPLPVSVGGPSPCKGLGERAKGSSMSWALW